MHSKISAAKILAIVRGGGAGTRLFPLTKHIIAALMQKCKVFAYIFQGYWEDIGTVRAFFEANLALTDRIRPYNP
jgi:ADP-glucose pyrophosphorylase